MQDALGSSATADGIVLLRRSIDVAAVAVAGASTKLELESRSLRKAIGADVGSLNAVHQDAVRTLRWSVAELCVSLQSCGGGRDSPSFKEAERAAAQVQRTFSAATGKTALAGLASTKPTLVAMTEGGGGGGTAVVVGDGGTSSGVTQRLLADRALAGTLECKGKLVLPESPWQRPGVFFDGLPTMPFWYPRHDGDVGDVAQFDWIPALEAATPHILLDLKEIDTLAQTRGSGVPTWNNVGSGVHRQSGGHDGSVVSK